jgi:hypothetical protein
MQVTLNDTMPATMLFDTGAASGFCLWSTYAEKHGIEFDRETMAEDDSGDNPTKLVRPTSPLSAKIGAAASGHSALYIGRASLVGCDGLFAPNFKSDKRVWELNTENDYVQIHTRDTIPPASMEFPMELYDKAGLNALVTIPITLVGKQGDTLQLNNRYMFDTGTPYTVVFFEREDGRLKGFYENQPHIDDEFVVKETRVWDVVLPDGRFGFWRNRPDHIFPQDVAGTLGVGFLKHFNVFIDLKNGRLFLQKHGREWKRTQYSNVGCYIVRNRDGQLRVGRIFEGSPAEAAGLKNGDIIAEIDGMESRGIDDACIAEIYKTLPGTVVEIVVKDADSQRRVSVAAYDDPLNCYNENTGVVN